ncbi:MAG TPA: dockerin type I repeat-containing protein, partial [Terriglobales bacterium]|nr:dockerin type I repeat-containing protein [Terriglobales bacterium]
IYSDTAWVKIHFVVTDSFYYPEFVKVNNGAMVTTVTNVGNMGNRQDSSGMFYNGHDFLYDFSPVMCINIPGYGDKSAAWVHGRKDFLPLSHVQMTNYPGLKMTRVRTEFAPVSTSSLPPYHWFWWWYALEQEDIFFWKPAKPPANNPVHYERAILKCTKLHQSPPPPWWSYITSEPPTLPDAYLGFWADFDVPSQAFLRNKGGFDQSRNLIWIYSDSSGFQNYYGACLFLNAVKDSDTSRAPFAAYILRDTSDIYAPPEYPYDTLCKYLTNPGWEAEQDSATDMSILVSGIELRNVAPATMVTMKYALMVTDQGKADLDTMANQIRRVRCGDVNTEGNVMVSDVVYLVNYLFKGGPEPWLYYCDANGDCQVTVSDVVYLVNYLFKGGPQVKCNCVT